MPDFNPRDLAAWRELCEYIEDWLAKSGPPSRWRSSIHTSEVPEHLRPLLATPMRRRAEYLNPVGNLCGLTQAQAREAQRARTQYRLVVWGRAAGEGWSLCRGPGVHIVWREWLAELEAAARG